MYQQLNITSLKASQKFHAIQGIQKLIHLLEVNVQESLGIQNIDPAWWATLINNHFKLITKWAHRDGGLKNGHLTSMLGLFAEIVLACDQSHLIPGPAVSLNYSPHADGWYFKIDDSNPSHPKIIITGFLEVKFSLDRLEREGQSQMKSFMARLGRQYTDFFLFGKPLSNGSLYIELAGGDVVKLNVFARRFQKHHNKKASRNQAYTLFSPSFFNYITTLDPNIVLPSGRTRMHPVFTQEKVLHAFYHYLEQLVAPGIWRDILTGFKLNDEST